MIPSLSFGEEEIVVTPELFINENFFHLFETKSQIIITPDLSPEKNKLLGSKKINFF